MSIVCGLVANSTLYVGSDTQVRIGGARYDMRKICVLPESMARGLGGTWIVGVAGDMRAVNALSDLSFINGSTIDDVMRAVKDACALLAPKGSGDPWPFEMVVARSHFDEPARLWVVSNTMTHTAVAPGRLAAVGAGMQAALGAWVVCAKDVSVPIRAPLDAAIAVNALCGGSRDIVRLNGGAPMEWLD